MGLVWLIGRIIYGYGYAKNGPTGRRVGAAMHEGATLPVLLFSWYYAIADLGDYKIVMIVYLIETFVNATHYFLIGKARKEFKVEYPDLYADKSNEHHEGFNRIQRAH